jgi:hypothetical protein
LGSVTDHEPGDSLLIVAAVFLYQLELNTSPQAEQVALVYAGFTNRKNGVIPFRYLAALGAL